MKKTLLIVSLVLALLLLTAGAALWAAGTRQEEDPMEKNVKLLMKAGDLDRDSAEGSVELLGELGVGELKKAEKLESRFGTTLRVTDRDGRVFYLGYGGLGYLEIVRKDAPDGEILYAPED
ncbi:MAG: hypothetical protein IJQ43_08585 [Oscillospiraceae bacterium]|nr:hypothetical protein [Oscillospiraceae bacterium]